MKTFLEMQLVDGEEIVASFCPDLKKTFAAKDAFLVPLSLVFLFWTLSLLFDVFTQNDKFTSTNIYVILAFVCALYFVFGRFFVKKMRKKRLVYFVTNKRFCRVTKSLFGKKNFESVDIVTTKRLDIDGNPQFPCTIIFSDIPFSYTSFFANTGLAIGAPFNAFYDVNRPEQLCKKIIELKKHLLEEEKNKEE